MCYIFVNTCFNKLRKGEKKQQTLLTVLFACWTKDPSDGESRTPSSTAACSSETTATPRRVPVLTEDGVQRVRGSVTAPARFPCWPLDERGGSPQPPTLNLRYLQRGAAEGRKCQAGPNAPCLPKGRLNGNVCPVNKTRGLRWISNCAVAPGCYLQFDNSWWYGAEMWALLLGKIKMFSSRLAEPVVLVFWGFQGIKRILTPAQHHWSWYQINRTPLSLAETISVRYCCKRIWSTSEQRSVCVHCAVPDRDQWKTL